MTKELIVSIVAAAVLCGAFAMPAQALARDHHHRGHREVIVFGHDRYHYRDGRFYRPGWFGVDVALSVPPIGVVVSAIPAGYTTVFVGGGTYFCYNHVYYRRHPRGYIVVEAPVMAAQAPAVAAPPAQPAVIPAAPATGNTDAVIINVPNTDGSYTPVRLLKRYKGYEGPQGEYYPEHPTVEQLRALYGK